MIDKIEGTTRDQKVLLAGFEQIMHELMAMVFACGIDPYWFVDTCKKGMIPLEKLKEMEKEIDKKWKNKK